MSANGAKPRLSVEMRRVLGRLRRDLAKLNQLGAEEGLAFDELALLYAALDRVDPAGLSQQLASVRDFVRSRTARAYPRGEDRAVVEGAGVLELCSAGAKDVWAGPLLVKTLAARCADEAFDRGTGEALPPGALAEKVADTIIDVAGLDTASQTFRKGKVTSYGLVPGEFYERATGTLSIRFVD